jgi:esterase/lipase superfamily enzyme
MRGFLSVLAALVLAGCGARTEGVLLPAAETADGAHRVEMLVATTRLPSDKPGELFSGERARFVSLADIVISVPPDGTRAVGDVQWPARTPADPAREFAALRAERIDLPAAQANLQRLLRTKGHGRVLVFVHGYNSRFDEAVFRLAQIAHDSGAPAVPILFTWPSRGRVLEYGYDRESANYSRDALEGVLAALQKNPAITEISILAHSMGNWVTLEALRQMAIRDKRIAPKIRHVMLAAPDVDIDVFRSQINQIGVNRPYFVLLSSRDDVALDVSRRLWGSTVRLGAVDPQAEPFRTDLARDRIDVVDLTALKGRDDLAHGKFAQVPEVVRAIGLRLAGGQTLHDGRASLGERIAVTATSGGAVIGGAAGLILSAPAAIVDPRSRESFGDQTREVGTHTRDALTSSTSR